MSIGPEHLIIAPILVPFFAGAAMLLYDDRRRREKFIIGLISVFVLLGVAVELLMRSKGNALSGGNDIGFYLLGDWASPWGIVLVIDRLSAMMLVITALLAIPALLYASAGWHGQGPHYHSMFQFLLMGVNGAFLTGDLFNLFVFFEVMLAASYGLVLHGSGRERVGAGMHYIVVNLVASLVFLLGVSLIYGVTGTLNMADLATAVPSLNEQDRALFHVGAGLLGLVFMVKAGIWPLSFWLPSAYTAGAAPVAAIFAIMTKVGIYVILRLSMLNLGDSGGASAGFGSTILVFGGIATVIYGTLGVLASQSLGRMTAHLVLISSGTVLGIIGFALMGGGIGMLAGALYYLFASTLATSALFLLVEPMSREEGGIAAMLALTADAWGSEERESDEEQVGLGFAIPGTMTVLGLSFGVCVLALAGLPPFPGFIGKVAMLRGILGAEALPDTLAWSFVVLLILSGFGSLIGLARIGIQTFWASDAPAPRVLALEFVPVLILVAMLAILSIRGEDAMRYMYQTSSALHRPSIYIEGVIHAPRMVDVEPAAVPIMPEVTLPELSEGVSP